MLRNGSIFFLIRKIKRLTFFKKKYGNKLQMYEEYKNFELFKILLYNLVKNK